MTRSNNIALKIGMFTLLLGIAMPEFRSPASAAEGEAVKVPLTLGNIWYRQQKKTGMGKLKVYKLSGDLRVTTEGLEFAAKDKRLFVPLADLRMVSLGKMGRDVDTDWVIVSFDKGGATEVFGFRDGSKMGYGTRTQALNRKLRAAMKLLHAAQYNVPEGYKAFDQLDYQIAFAIPDDWSTYVQSMVVVSGQARWGTIIFSSEPTESQSVAEPGAPPAFFLDRREKSRGMSCDGFSPKAQAKLLGQIGEDPLFGTGFEVVEPPRASPITLGGCSGVKVEARSRAANGSIAVLDMHVVTHGSTLYLFGVRSFEESRDAYLEPFGRSLATVRFSSAKE